MRDSGSVEAFSFAFQPPLDTWARWFAIVPTRSFVRIDDHGFEAVYGPWRVATTWSNVRGVERSGPYRPWKIAGPVRVSWADRGITMAATTAEGVCLRLHEPVPGLDPLGLFRHPAVTLGVDDVDRFVQSVEATTGSVRQANSTNPRTTIVAAWAVRWGTDRDGGDAVSTSSSARSTTVLSDT